MSIMHDIVNSPIKLCAYKWKKIKYQATKSLQKGGEIGIPMGKTHTPKTKNFISYYKKEKTMKSSLKSKESLHNFTLEP